MKRLDEQVREYIRELRKLGVIINAHVVIAVGMGLVLNKDANLLAENGGHIVLPSTGQGIFFQEWAL